MLRPEANEVTDRRECFQQGLNPPRSLLDKAANYHHHDRLPAATYETEANEANTKKTTK